MLDIHQLACFAAAYQTKSISKAAESMFISQQAVSHNIRKLEDALGSPLFDRTSSGITPTALGEALIDDAKRLLGDCAALEEKAAVFNRRSAGISMAYADGIFSVEDAADLGQLTRYVNGELRTPLLLQEHTTSECLSMLKNGEADILCIFNPPQDDAQQTETLRSYPLYVGMGPGHPLADRQVITTEDMTHYPLIIDQRDDALNTMMNAYSAREGMTARRYAPSTQLSSFADIMRRDNSLLMFTQPFVRAYAGADAVVIPYALSDAVLRLCAVYRKKHPERAKLTKITAWLKSQYR